VVGIWKPFLLLELIKLTPEPLRDGVNKIPPDIFGVALEFAVP
jgi:hypothetical protein